jgi:CRP/FNR family transcriptional regulator
MLRSQVGRGMKTETPFKRFAAFADLTSDERNALKDLAAQVSHYGRNEIIRHEQDPVDGVFLLIEGWVLTTASLAEGDRQVLKIHLPGDIMGAPSLALERSAETVTAVTEVVVSKVPERKLSRIFVDHPRLAMLFFLAAQEERVILMDRLTSLGRRSAKQSLCALLIHLHDRIALPDETGVRSFELPLNQGQIADVMGIHLVHVNRMFRALEDDGLVLRGGKRITLLKVDEIRRTTGLPERHLARNISWLPPAS